MKHFRIFLKISVLYLILYGQGLVVKANSTNDSNRTQITVTINIIGNGSVSVDGELYSQPLSYEGGTTIQIDAIADFNWEFESWEGDIVSFEPSQIVQIESDINISATFIDVSNPYYTLDIGQIGIGSVSVNGNIYTQTLEFLSGSSVSIIAIPDDGWLFVGWEGDFSISEPSIDTIITQNVSIIARFRPIQSPELIPEYGTFDEANPINPTTVIVWYDASEVLSVIRKIGDDEEVMVEGSDFSISDIDDDTSLLNIFLNNKKREAYSKGEYLINYFLNFDVGVTLNYQVMYHELEVYSIDFQIVDEYQRAVSDAIVSLNGVDYYPGQYVISSLEPATYPYSVHREGYQTAFGVVNVSNSDVVESVVLNTFYLVQFSISYQNTPIENVVIEVADTVLYTNDEGYAQLWLVNGSYDYVAQIDGFYLVENSFEVNGENQNIDISMIQANNQQIPIFNSTIYPNPVQDRLIVFSEQEGVYSVVIVDIYGKVVYRKSQSTKQFSLLTNNLSRGLYYMHIMGNSVERFCFVKE